MSTAVQPVRLSVEVPLAADEAFELFTAGIAEWWPYKTHFSRGPVETLVFETRLGGALKEVCSDGVVAQYGEVIGWEPPRRVVIKWMVAPHRVPPTEVEIRFTPTISGTRLELEHRGFAEESQRDSYGGGWPGVLRLFAELSAARAR
jgi:uncharacterized protein YndB with AHSA1/START domain